MKIYQVYSGGVDKHGHQTKEYLATYSHRYMAMDHCHELVRELLMQGEVIEETAWGKEDEKECGIVWTAEGWDYVNICYLYERSITA